MSASGATDGRPHHQKPSFATLAAVVTDFRNEIGTKRTSFTCQLMVLASLSIEALSCAEHVCFSNRPFGVKHFQTIHPCGVDVARGLVLLFGIGTKALPSWDTKTRWNNLRVGLL